jgi:hypothetical protein
MPKYLQDSLAPGLLRVHYGEGGGSTWPSCRATPMERNEIVSADSGSGGTNWGSNRLPAAPYLATRGKRFRIACTGGNIPT